MKELVPENKIDNDLIEKGNVLQDWFVFRDTRHFGPLSSKQVKHFLSKRMLSTNHHIWRPGFEDWTKIADIEAFKSYGGEVIKKMSDDNFSHTAVPRSIDRIAIEKREFEFLDEFQQNITSRLDEIEKTEAEERHNFFYDTARMFTNYPKVFKGMGLSLMFAVALGSYFMMESDPREAVLSGLKVGVKNKLKAISELEESVSNPDFVAFENFSNPSEPKFVAATNLPVGSKLSLKITGLPGTMVGLYRFEKDYAVTVEDKVFGTEALRQASGEYLPSGQYKFEAACLNCGKEEVKLFSENFNFGIADMGAYKLQLREFQAKTYEAAKLELQELKDLSNTLDQQLTDSTAAFNKFSKKFDVKKWDKFAPEWLATQKRIVELFGQMKSEKFKAELYYLPLYEAYGELTKKIFEVHVMQDGYISQKGAARPSMKQIFKETQEASLRVTYLRTQLEQMQVNFKKKERVPSQTGLSI